MSGCNFFYHRRWIQILSIHIQFITDTKPLSNCKFISPQYAWTLNASLDQQPQQGKFDCLLGWTQLWINRSLWWAFLVCAFSQKKSKTQKYSCNSHQNAPVLLLLLCFFSPNSVKRTKSKFPCWTNDPYKRNTDNSNSKMRTLEKGMTFQSPEQKYFAEQFFLLSICLVSQLLRRRTNRTEIFQKHSLFLHQSQVLSFSQQQRNSLLFGKHVAQFGNVCSLDYICEYLSVCTHKYTNRNSFTTTWTKPTCTENTCLKAFLDFAFDCRSFWNASTRVLLFIQTKEKKPTPIVHLPSLNTGTCS